VSDSGTVTRLTQKQGVSRCIIVIACDKREAFAHGSSCDEAIHFSACGAMDCFAALAMMGWTAPDGIYVPDW
jgi:hypothetical protein